MVSLNMFNIVSAVYDDLIFDISLYSVENSVSFVELYTPCYLKIEK